jgi:pimeloyl-ACP methyl ester carboxylesterase
LNLIEEKNMNIRKNILSAAVIFLGIIGACSIKTKESDNKKKNISISQASEHTSKSKKNENQKILEYKVKDVTIYYEIHGKGMPVLMIHGWGTDHRMMKGCMEPVFQSLDTSFKRIYFDLPGMGKTEGQPWITGTDQMLEIILEFIDGIIPNQQFIIVGKSYGGYLARGIIKDRSSFIDGLLLICPLANPETRTANAPAFEVLEKDEALLESLSDEDLKYFKEINVLQNERVWERFKEDILPGLKIADNEFLMNNLSQNVPYSFNVDLVEKPYQQPTLVLLGKQDCIVGYRDQWKFIENFIHASFVILDKAGHNLEIEQESLFNELVKEWLNRFLIEN